MAGGFPLYKDTKSIFIITPAAEIQGSFYGWVEFLCFDKTISPPAYF